MGCLVEQSHFGVLKERSTIVESQSPIFWNCRQDQNASTISQLYDAGKEIACLVHVAQERLYSFERLRYRARAIKKWSFLHFRFTNKLL
jgi:hypothetical protein